MAEMKLAILVAVAFMVLHHLDAGAGGGANCPTTCGNITVPYPFGLVPGCHLPGFNLTCNRTSNPPTLLLGDGTLQVVGISLPNATVHVKTAAINITHYATPNGAVEGNGTWGGLGDGGGPFILSDKHNQFVVTGCNVQAKLLGNSTNIITGCSSFCSMTDTWSGVVTNSTRGGGSGTCSGIGCCQTPIPIGRASYAVQFKYLDLEYYSKLPIWVIVAEHGWSDGISIDKLNGSAPTSVPAVLEWAINSTTLLMPRMADANSTCPKDVASGACRSRYSSCRDMTSYYRSGYACFCNDGYDGNPYITDGCQDVDECMLPGKCYGECRNRPGWYECWCPRGARGDPYVKHGCVKSSAGLSIGIGVGSGAGLLLLGLGAIFVTRKLKDHKAKLLKQKFFKQNRGQLLQQLIYQNTDIAERMIISLEELEKATNNFDSARKLGGGGHGTVYKGILSDLHVVAIKKSKIVIQREINEFINEVAILSQINHRNVVKLFGCCLETEVPLLVYEFISNGTLFDHLHVQGPKSLLWDDRLRIARETARALAYLHSAVSTPIIHRDIKSSNILLDESLTAKVSDFGASRYIPVDRTGVTTAVQGTIGYLDPMYYYTGRLTEKSDIYSFGVILVELLTRKKPFSYRSSQGDSLVAHFVALLAECSLVDILDPQVVEEGGEEAEKVAALAAMCVRLKEEDRPAMRQVEMALESLRISKENAPPDVSVERSKENRTAVSYTSIEGGSSEEASRQYSLEEEYLLSARYPR